MKIVIEGNNVSINKGSESIWLDIDPHSGEVDISATCGNGGYLIAELRFAEDEVVLKRAYT